MFVEAGNICNNLPSFMKLLRILWFSSIAAFILLLSSCIDGREEIWLEPDGSGKAHFQYDIPAAAAKFQGGEKGIQELLDSILKDFPDATKTLQISGDRLKIDVNLSFTSQDVLSKLRSSIGAKKSPQALRHLAGVFEVKREGLTVDFTRTISPGLALPTAFIPASEFKNRKLTYILHLPVVPTESTADRIGNNGFTQIWEQPLSTAIRKPIVMHFKAKAQIPNWLMALGIITSTIVVTALIMISRKWWLHIHRLKQNKSF